jgi:hypothetical protein
MRKNHGAGETVGDMMAGAERIGDGMSSRRVHWTKAEAAVKRRQRKTGAGLAIRAVGHGTAEIAADQPDALESIQIDGRMRLAAREGFHAMRQRIGAGGGGDLCWNTRRQIRIDDREIGKHEAALHR